MQFAAEGLSNKEARHRLADQRGQAMALADQAGIVCFGTGAGKVEPRRSSEGNGSGAFNPGHSLGILRARQPQRPITAHSSVRISTVSPSSRNNANGAHAASNGG